MKKKLSTATILALFANPGLEMLLVGFETLWNAVLSSFVIPLCSTDGKITHCWMKLRSSGVSQNVAKGGNMWMTEKNRQKRFCYIDLSSVLCSLLPDPALCFLERRHVDRLILRMKTTQNLTTWQLFTELKCVLFILEVKNKSTGTSPSLFSIRFHILPLAQVVQKLLSPFCFV